jgi:polyhydroxyalkanoate synthesis repressor PhaR
MPAPADGPPRRRVIKRYSNRKLYDTKESRYVTLLQIAEMIRADEDIQVFDTTTQEDKTDVTLALIISEEMKTRPRAIPLATLKALIRHRGERLLSPLREGPMGRLIPDIGGEGSEDGAASSDASSDAAKGRGLRGTLEQWHAAVDARIRHILPDFTTIRELQTQLSRLHERLDALEARLPASPPPAEPES